jgi:hypothetical protein
MTWVQIPAGASYPSSYDVSRFEFAFPSDVTGRSLTAFDERGIDVPETPVPIQKNR